MSRGACKVRNGPSCVHSGKRRWRASALSDKVRTSAGVDDRKQWTEVFFCGPDLRVDLVIRPFESADGVLEIFFKRGCWVEPIWCGFRDRAYEVGILVRGHRTSARRGVCSGKLRLFDFRPCLSASSCRAPRMPAKMAKSLQLARLRRVGGLDSGAVLATGRRFGGDRRPRGRSS